MPKVQSGPSKENRNHNKEYKESGKQVSLELGIQRRRETRVNRTKSLGKGSSGSWYPGLRAEGAACWGWDVGRLAEGLPGAGTLPGWAGPSELGGNAKQSWCWGIWAGCLAGVASSLGGLMKLVLGMLGKELKTTISCHWMALAGQCWQKEQGNEQNQVPPPGPSFQAPSSTPDREQRTSRRCRTYNAKLRWPGRGWRITA